MKRFLLFFLIAALCVFCLAACNDETPPAGDETPGDETPGDETPGDETPGDETPGDETPGDETPGDETPGDETPGDETPGDETPGDEKPGDETPDGGGTEEQGRKVLETLAGQTAKELYAGVEAYLSLLRNVTVRGSVTDEYEEESLKKSAKQSVTMLVADRLLSIELCEETANGEKSTNGIWYDGSYLYVMDSTDGAFKMEMAYEDFSAQYGGSYFENISLDDVLMFESVILYEENGTYYIELVANPQRMTATEQLSLLPTEDGILEGYVVRVTLDAQGKYLSDQSTLTYSVRKGDERILHKYIADTAISDLGVTAVKGPAHPDIFVDVTPEIPPEPETVTVTFLTGTGTPVEDQEIVAGTLPARPDDPKNSTFVFCGWYTDFSCTVAYDFTVPLYEDTVLYAKWTPSRCDFTFFFVDPNGSFMMSKDGKISQEVTHVTYGSTAHSYVYLDETAFADYIVVGWDVDGDGIRDDKDGRLTATGGLVVAYSIVKTKDATVKFLHADGSPYCEMNIKLGDTLEEVAPAHPVVFGKAFVGWETVSGNPAWLSNGAVFRASYTAVDGTIGKVAKGSIVLDGKCDDAYLTSGAYLPLNTQRQADLEITAAKDVNQGGTRAVPTMRADTYIVWDGEYIYVLIAVSDTTLTGRSEQYLKAGIDSWLNDTIELRYCFEQDLSLTKNHTRVGVDAMGYSKYALGRSEGIGGGRSTHYEDISYAVRNRMLGHTGTDLSATGYVNDETYDGIDKVMGKAEPARLASYIVEIRLPARTEGKADLAKGADERTGRLPFADPLSNDAKDYAFTEGEALCAGNFVRFSLQVNDLLILKEDMTGEVGAQFWDSPPMEEICKCFPYYSDKEHTMMLYHTDMQGNITEHAVINNRFSAAGNTQQKLSEYLIFALGADERGESKVQALGYRNGRNVWYSDKAGTVFYFRD